MASSFGFVRSLAGGRPLGSGPDDRAWAPRCRLAVVLAVVVCGVLGLAGSAFAGEKHLFEAAFGPDGTAGSAFERPAAVGVDQSSGAVYVADVAAGTVEKFNVAHEPEAFAGIAPNIVGGRLTGFSFFSESLNQLAVNSASHDFYVVNYPSKSVKAFQSDGEPALFTAGPGAGSNEIHGPETCGVAVDANGDIYTGNVSSVKVYAPSGEPLTTIPLPVNGCSVAVDSHGTVYVNQFQGPVEKFIPSAFPVTSSTTYASGGIVDANTSWGVAVDPSTDHLYVDEHTQVAVYDELGSRLGNFGAAGPGALVASEGLAVNTVTGRIYVSDAAGSRQVEIFGLAVVVPDVITGEASQVLSRSATLNGTANPKGVQLSDCHFDYGTTKSYGLTAPCKPAAGEIPVDSNVHAVSADIKELQPGTTYHFRLQAENANASGIPSLGEDATFATPPPPAISNAVASNVTASSVDLSARVNPGGLETTYHFEWGTSMAYGTSVPVPDGHIAAGTSGVPVGVHLSGLTANTTYHWRVLATNASGTTMGVDHTFVYGTAGGGGLPDGRAYEMVTPSYKNGALIGDATAVPRPVVGEDGSRVLAGTVQCFAGAGSCSALRARTGSLYAFSRTAGGWVASSLAPSATSQSENNTWDVYSADAGTALFSMPTAPFGEDDFYARRPDGSFVDVGPVSPPSGGPSFNAVIGTRIGGATADLSHVVFTSTSGVWLSKEGLLESLFEYVGTGNSVPSFVGVSGGLGSTDLISACDTFSGGGGNSFGAMSGDGRTAFFTAAPCGSGTGSNEHVPVPVYELFARVDNGEAGAHTVAISQPSVISPVPPNHECNTPVCVANTTNTAQFRSATFVGASGDGSKVFFASAQQLTDSASEDSGNLYLYDFGSPVGERLVSVSGDPAGGPRVQGVMALSSDGSHVYFVAKGVLTGAANGVGQVARDGAENLYVFERDAGYPQGRVVFVAVLPEADNREWTAPTPGEPANVTPDGRFLVFTSSGVLTSDTTRSDGAQQVFRYDAQSGGLVRVSIGEHGFNDNGNGGVGSAGIVPGKEGFIRAGVARTDPTMSHDGAFVFFMSPVGLTPGALNSVPVGTNPVSGRVEYAENVYEYHEGQVFLVSDGRDTSTAPQELCVGSISAVCLFGVDGTGANVFFTTADQLVAQDTDTQLDFYDARVCTAGDPCITGPPPGLAGCVGEGCRGVPAGAPSLQGAGSAVFSGAGNLAPPVSGPAVRARALSRAQKLARALGVCRSRHRGRGRAGCEARARKRYGSKSRARSTSRRGGK